MTLNNGAKFLQVMVLSPISQGTGFQKKLLHLLSGHLSLIRAKILEGRHPRYAHQSNDGSCLGHVASQCLLAGTSAIRLPQRSLVCFFKLQPTYWTYCAVQLYVFQRRWIPACASSITFGHV